MSSSADLFSGLPQELSEIVSKLGPLAASLDLTAIAAKRVKDATARYMDIADRIKAMGASGSYAADEMAELQDQLKKAYGSMNQAAASASSLKEAHKLLEKAVKDNTSTYEKFYHGVIKSQQVMTKWLPLFGGQTITLKGAKDALVKYNQSMFDLQRSYQVSSSGSQAFSKALVDVSKNTTLSTNQFLDFAKAASSGWKGMAPGIAMVGKLASAFQNKLGPTLEATQEGLRATMDLMEKFPSLGKSTANAIIALNEGAAGSKEQAERQKGLIALMAITGQVSRKTLITQSQLLSGVTSEQEKQIDTNQELARTVQKFEDTILKLGQQMEPALLGMTKLLNGMMDVLKKMPAQIMAIGMAFKMMSSQMIGAGGVGSKALKGMVGEVGGAGGRNIALSAVGGVTGFSNKKAIVNALKSSGAYNPATNGMTPKLLSGIGGKALSGLKIGGAMAVVQGGIGGYQEYSERKSAGDKNAGKAGVTKGATIAASAAAGAAIGSIIPGLGTAVGAVIGGIAGSLGGGLLGEAITDKLFPLDELEKSENVILDIDMGSKNLKDSMSNVNGEAVKLALSLMEAQANQEYLYDIAKSTFDLFKQEIDILSQVGLIDYGNVDEYFGRAIQKIAEAEQAARSYFETLSGEKGALQILKVEGLDDVKRQIEDVMKSSTESGVEVFLNSGDFSKIEKILSISNKAITVQIEEKTSQIKTGGDEDGAVQKEIDALLTKQAATSKLLEDFSKNRLKIINAEAQKVDEVAKSWNAAADNARQLNSVYESRLDMERELMESAQFGMGASLSMMQQQVDMAHELINLEQKRIDLSDGIVASKLKSLGMSEAETKSTMAQLKASKSHMQTQQIINSTTKGINAESKDRAGVERLLSLYAKDQQDASLKQMQQQKKIYDLTKDIREGYLDALREMSSGAGEFEKIIGTQTMGTSQLMDAVDKFTTTGQKNILNTGALGGRQSKEMTRSGVGQTYMGQYSASLGMPAAIFQSDEMLNKGTDRYYRKNQSEEEYRKLKEGKHRATLGSSGALTDAYAETLHGANVDSDYESQMAEGGFPDSHYKKDEKATENAIINANRKMRGSAGTVIVSNGVQVGGEGGGIKGKNLDRGIHAIWREPGGKHPSSLNEKQSPNLGVAMGEAVSAGSVGSLPGDPSSLIAGSNKGVEHGNEPWDRQRGRELNQRINDIEIAFQEEMAVVMNDKDGDKSSKMIDSLTYQLGQSDKEVSKIVKGIAKQYGITGQKYIEWMTRFSKEHRRLSKELMDVHENSPARKHEKEMASLDPSKIFRDKGGTTYYDMEVPIQTSGFRGGSAVPPAEMPTGAGSVPPSQMPNVSESAVPPAEMPTVGVSHAAISDAFNGPQKAEVATDYKRQQPNPTEIKSYSAEEEVNLAKEFEKAYIEYNNSFNLYRGIAIKLADARESGAEQEELVKLKNSVDQSKKNWESNATNLSRLQSLRSEKTFSYVGREILSSDNELINVTKSLIESSNQIAKLNNEEIDLGGKTDDSSLDRLVAIKKEKTRVESEIEKLKQKRQTISTQRSKITGISSSDGGLAKTVDIQKEITDAYSEIDAIGEKISKLSNRPDWLLGDRTQIEELKEKRAELFENIEYAGRELKIRQQESANARLAHLDLAEQAQIDFTSNPPIFTPDSLASPSSSSKVAPETNLIGAQETPKALNDATIDRLFKVSASLTSQSDVTDSISKPFSSAYESAVNSFDRDSAEKKIREQHELDKKQGKKALVGEGWFAQEANLQAHESGMQAVVDAGKDIGLTQKDAIQSFKKERGEITGKPDPRKQAESAEVKLSQHQNDEMKKNGIRSASGKEGRAEKPKMSGFNDGSAKLEGKGGESHFDDGPTRLENKGGKSELGGPRKAHSRGGDRLEDYKWKPLKRADPFGYRISEAASGAEKAEKESQRSNKWNASAPDTKRQLSEIYGMEDGGGGVGGKAIIRIELAKGLDVATGSNDQVKGAVLEIIRSAS